MRASMQAHTHAGMRNTSKQHEHASTPTCKHTDMQACNTRMQACTHARTQGKQCAPDFALGFKQLERAQQHLAMQPLQLC